MNVSRKQKLQLSNVKLNVRLVKKPQQKLRSKKKLNLSARPLKQRSFESSVKLNDATKKSVNAKNVVTQKSDVVKKRLNEKCTPSLTARMVHS